MDPKTEQAEEPITAGKLKEVSGLSSRQINEWDSRDALPSQRDGERGWRRTTLSQAVAVTIAAKVNKTFGTPVGELRPMIAWMQGEPLTVEGLVGRRRAEDHLVQLTQKEIDATQKWFNAAAKKGSVKRIKARTDGVVEHSEPNPTSGKDALYEPLIEDAVPRLVNRGWQTDAARQFCELFYDMSGRGKGTAGVLGEYLLLDRLAGEAHDRIARQAAQMVATALVPLVGVIGDMSAGLPVYLVTDLHRSRFLNEFALADFARAELLRDGQIVLYLNDALNEMFEKLGKPRMEVKHSAADADDADAITEKEAQILRLLRGGKFTSAYIRPVGQNYNVVIERPMQQQEVEQAVALVSKHDYETVVIKTSGGKTVHATRSVSHIVK
jgi:hypothetical protein